MWHTMSDGQLFMIKVLYVNDKSKCHNIYLRCIQLACYKNWNITCYINLCKEQKLMIRWEFYVKFCLSSHKLCGFYDGWHNNVVYHIESSWNYEVIITKMSSKLHIFVNLKVFIESIEFRNKKEALYFLLLFFNQCLQILFKFISAKIKKIT